MSSEAEAASSKTGGGSGENAWTLRGGKKKMSSLKTEIIYHTEENMKMYVELVLFLNIHTLLLISSSFIQLSNAP